MPLITDARQWPSRLKVARDPALLALGAVLLVCAPVFPGLSRLVVLPALLLAPGYALLRLLGHAARPRSISVAVPVSLVLAVCASLVLDVSGIRLGPLSLGSLLGALTALLLAGSYGRHLIASRPLKNRATNPRDRELAQPAAPPSERGDPPATTRGLVVPGSHQRHTGRHKTSSEERLNRPGESGDSDI